MNIDMNKQIERLRQSTLVKENVFGDVSSFNFTKKAFYNKKWNELTTKARGLFVNTETGNIVARGYDKFFNIGELQNTCRAELRRKLKFPVTAYRKENGFLGLISWDKETNDLRFTTKSSVDGFYVDILKNTFMNTVEDLAMAKMMLRQDCVTLLVEVIDPANDPHIIEYSKPHVVALDLVRNEWDTMYLPYHDLELWCKAIGIPCKQIHEVYETWTDLEAAIDKWITGEYRDGGEPVEGYVVVDRDGYMFKVKTGYYTKWKRYRWLADRYLLGLEDDLPDEPFLNWVKEESAKGNINCNYELIQLRNMYEERTNDARKFV